MRQLRYFVQIVESGSLAKASRQLFIAQPALTQHVARLEEEVGESLLQRSSKGVVATESGAALYRHAKFLLRQLQETVAVARQKQACVGGRVAIGLAPTNVLRFGQALLEQVETRFPGIQLNVVEGASSQLEAMARGGQLDLAVLFTPHAASDLDAEPLFDEELVVILPEASDLVAAGRTEIRLREVAQLPLVLPTLRHPARHRRIELEFERAGLAVQAIAEIDSLHLVMSMIERRGAATIKPRSALLALGGDPARWRCLRIGDVPVRRPNYLYALPASKLTAAALAVQGELKALVRDCVEAGRWEGVALASRDATPRVANPHRLAVAA